MSIPAITHHAATRMKQRGLFYKDVELIFKFGTDIGRDRIMLTRKDAATITEELKRMIATVNRLTDKVIVVEEGRLITAYHRSKAIQPYCSKHRNQKSSRVCIEE